MALDRLLADYWRPGTHRVYDYRHPTAEEMLYGIHATAGGYGVEWDPDLRRLQYWPIIAMAWSDPRPDQPRGATFFVGYFHETSIEEAVTPDDAAQRGCDEE